MWAKIVGKQHWTARNIVNTVYDRSIITAMVDVLYDKEKVRSILKAWEPFPDYLFYCKVSALEAYERNKKRSSKDEFDSLESLQEYELKYDEAVEFLKQETNINVIELDATLSTQKNVEKVKEILQNGK